MKITKEQFQKMTSKFQGNNSGKTKSVIFGRDVFERILSNADVKQVSVFFAENDDAANTVALIGIDANNQLMYDTIEDLGGLCPPNCQIG